MRFITASVLVLYLLNSSATGGELANEVWIDGSSFYRSVPHKKMSTIYFEKWDFYVQQFLDDENYFVALQLDRNFDPLPKDDVLLPSLASVAALNSEQVVDQYLTFLERYGRTEGINYMILPDTSGLSKYEKEVISKARSKSPYYFLNSTFLSRDVPLSRKEFVGLDFENPKIWLANQGHNFNRVRKWSSRYANGKESDFTEALRNSRNVEFIPVYQLPKQLKKELVSRGTIAVDPSHTLPVTDREVVYLGDDTKFRDWISNYAKVYDTPKEGIQRIVDLRGQDNPFEVGDILLTSQIVSDRITQLVLPTNYEGIEIDLCKMLFGGADIKGRHSAGRMIDNHHYLTYSTGQWENLSHSYEKKLDSLSHFAISNYATPGLQVAVIRNGSLILERSYGYYSYDSTKRVLPETLYDLASLTKVMATLPAVAYLLDQGRLALEDSVGKHLPDFIGSNKSTITIKQLLAHQGGLKSYIPFWSMMMDGDRLDAFYYKTPEDEALDRRSYGYEPDPILLDTLKSYIIKSKLIENTTKYNYSDLGFMILHMIVERITKQPLDLFMREKFYDPMGLKSLSFNPISKGFIHEAITPTEYDHRFRDYQVWGEVHDRNAAVFGGVAGHAGLFSNATDVAKMMSMLLNGGIYEGRQYLSSKALDQFNVRYYKENRRGLGWDKKDGGNDSASKYASDGSFGHTGFTGTMVWADPAEDLIFVFLSNRIYPDANNWRLSEFNTRTKMHDAIYESIISSE